MLGMIGALGVSFYYYIFGNQVLSVAFLIAAGFVPLMDTFAIYQSYLQGKKQFGIYSLYATIIQIIAVGLTVATLFLTDNILHILAVYFLSWTILRVIAFRLSIKYFPPNTTHDPKVITYGKHTSLIDAIATIIGSLDQILIFHFLGASGVAIYAFALAPATQLGGLFKNIPTLAIPKFAERPISSIRAQLKSRMLLLFLIGILSAAAYAFFAPFLYQWFFPQYIDSVRYSQALGFLLALSLPQTIFGAVISSKLTQTSEKLLYLWNIPGAVSLIVVLCTIQQLGIFSVVLGKFVHMSLVLAMNTIIWKNLIKNND